MIEGGETRLFRLVMGTLELFILAVGLSMDAFAVALCKGLAMEKPRLSSALVVGLWFGIFQALMPLLGYFLGVQFSSAIQSFDHWIAFLLLAAIGGNMIREAVKGDDEEQDHSISFFTMLPLAIATSIDALASGVALAAVQADILYAVAFIGITTFLLSAIAVMTGSKLGERFQSRAEIAGGIILILIALKTLIEHIGEGI